ncbi:MAG TPA: flagellin [Firmicutes bacterium]|jgi:flagellin|nr:flagellin [Bacillota bacterium]
MRINHNLSALNAWKNMSVNDTGQNKSLEKLSSGLRIGRAADDAAGLSISEKMRGQISGLNQASRNAQDGISLLQTAEGALQETHSILQRMRELAVQSASDTVTDADRVEIQKEVNALRVEMDRISTDTEFNTQKLLQGGFTDKTIHIGANADQNLKVNIASMGAVDLSVNGTTSFSDQELVTAGGGSVTINGTYSGEKVISEISFAVTIDATPENSKVGVTVKFADGSADLTGTLAMGNLSMTIPDGLTISLTAPNALTDETTIATLTDILPSKMVGIDVSSQDAANSAITTVNNAINTVSGERSKLGAIQNRLEHTIANLATSSENLTAAESRIRDVDIAVEMMNFTKYQILAQASTAMLAQANAKPQAVLQLLR